MKTNWMLVDWKKATSTAKRSYKEEIERNFSADQAKKTQRAQERQFDLLLTLGPNSEQITDLSI